MLRKEPHPQYIYNVFLNALDKKQKSLDRSIVYTVRAVLRDLEAYAQFEAEPAKSTIIAFIEKYEEAYLDSTGGGGGDDQVPEILQGP